MMPVSCRKFPSFKVTFNDLGPDIKQNVRVFAETPDVFTFKQDIVELAFESFDGGRDSKERLMQGLVMALQSAPEKSLIVVFTDNGSKDLNLKQQVGAFAHWFKRCL